MLTPRPERPDDPSRQPQRPQVPEEVRPKRTKERGPVGFGDVMRDVKRHGAAGRRGAGAAAGTRAPGAGGGAGKRAAGPGTGEAGTGALRDGAHRHGLIGGDGAGQGVAPGSALVQPPPPGMLGMAREVVRDSQGGKSGTEIGIEASEAPASSTEALQAEDASLPAQVHAQAGEGGTPAMLGRMTPRQALDVVVSESTRLAIEDASRELHIELEPADLGPLVIRLRRDGSKLDVQLRTRAQDTAELLEGGRDSLRDRLLALGFAQARVDVSHDPSLTLG